MKWVPTISAALMINSGPNDLRRKTVVVAKVEIGGSLDRYDQAIVDELEEVAVLAEQSGALEASERFRLIAASDGPLCRVRADAGTPAMADVFDAFDIERSAGDTSA